MTIRLVVVAVAFLFASCGKGKQEKVADEKLSISVKAGEVVYKTYCVSCHFADGGGAPPMNPPLTGTGYVLGAADQLVPVLLKGMSQQEVDGEQYHNVMPPFDFLTDEQIADVLTYVRNSFGNKASQVSVEEVKSMRQ